MPAQPAIAAAPVVASVVAWEQKLEWMIRLEDQRILRDPNPPPPVVLRMATAREPAIVAPPPPSDLVRLLNDGEARVRRRAALAVGRVGLAEGVEPLIGLLADTDVEVRQMAAFALGLIGQAPARAALVSALADAEPIVQGRAAEALGLIGDRADAAAVGAMVQVHVAAGALAERAPDDLAHPLPPPVEAARLGLFALARLGSYDALAAAALDARGQPVSSWWPVAYAFQRVGDARAAPTLTALLATPGRYTASFAVRGLAASTATQSVAALRQVVETRAAHPMVVIQAVRALATLGDRASTPLLIKIVADAAAEAALRAEAMTALSILADADLADLLVEVLLDRAPAIRGAALRALARINPDTFMATLAGLDPDPDWTVRAAEATALGGVPPEQSLARLTALLQDRDPRVVPVAIAALAVAKPPGVENLLLQKLRADDFVVRAAAATALADLKVIAAAGPLADAYRAAVGDSTYVARAAALTALNRLDPAAAGPVLQEALMDKDWAVRVRAAALLREQGAPDAEQTIRPAAPGRAVDDPEWLALASPQFSPRAFINTDKGTIEIELAVLDAPLTVNNFMTLARKGFFTGVAIHRVVPDFVVQDGDPRGDGEGGPGYTIRDEINQRPYLRGTVGMALDWKDTGGSQFFITHSPQPHLDARYTVFGHVVNGMDVVDRIAPWDVVRGVQVWDGVTPR
jgi:cyclophilin family peptidyl-prolyl cis-trans isomerase/HEAT repeat protein